jgi:quercetin dioxygenase-like cupin family protein
MKRQFLEREGAYRWDGLPVKDYPAAGTQSRGMTKQVLFNPDKDLCSELRYFEAEAGGHSALERHDHVHGVVILRGRGRVLLGDHVEEVAPFDTLYIPPRTWHQFYADADSPLGFLCLVNGDRDRPARPSEEDIAELKNNPGIAETIRY